MGAWAIELEHPIDVAVQGKIRIGISGWRYRGWRGVFYPAKLPQRAELSFASNQFSTIELNGSFYSLQRPESFACWYEQTPVDFVFAVKGSRYLTHMRRLREPEQPLANFVAQGILRLKEKLGPVLWQFPPSFKFDLARFEEFFELLPRTHRKAARLARKHDERLDDRCWFGVRDDLPMRHAVEIRHESFVCEEFVALLRRYGIGLVVGDTVEWPLLVDVTADFVYCRLHGSEQLYASGYGPKALDLWAERVMGWARGDDAAEGRRASATHAPEVMARDVYVYFDNDAKVRAPFDARRLMERVGLAQPLRTSAEVRS